MGKSLSFVNSWEFLKRSSCLKEADVSPKWFALLVLFLCMALKKKSL